MLKTYAYHKPSEAGLETIRRIREEFSSLHEHLVANTPKCRELSVALTNLETAAMWAIKAVVLDDSESTIPEIDVTKSTLNISGSPITSSGKLTVAEVDAEDVKVDFQWIPCEHCHRVGRIIVDMSAKVCPLCGGRGKVKAAI